MVAGQYPAGASKGQEAKVVTPYCTGDPYLWLCPERLRKLLKIQSVILLCTCGANVRVNSTTRLNANTANNTSPKESPKPVFDSAINIYILQFHYHTNLLFIAVSGVDEGQWHGCFYPYFNDCVSVCRTIRACV